jgi:hypothetical protein
MSFQFSDTQMQFSVKVYNLNCGWVHPVAHVSWIKYDKITIPHSQPNSTCIYCTRSFTTCFGFDKPSSSVCSPLLIYQNICGLREITDQLINSLFPKFLHILWFSEHHLKQIELGQINLGYKLGTAYCRKCLLKVGVCIFVHKKYNYSNGDLSKYRKAQVIEASALKLELTALNIHIVTVYRATCGNFNSSLNGLDSIIIKSLLQSWTETNYMGRYKYRPSHRQCKEKKAAWCCVTVLSFNGYSAFPPREYKINLTWL